MAKKDDKAVVNVEEAALPISVAELEGFAGEGFENTDSDSYAIPFLRVLQKLSPQADDESEAYVEGAKAGMFINTVTNELYGSEVKVIPLHYSRSFIEWKPNRGGFVKDHGNDPKILDRVVEITDKGESILDSGNMIQDTRNHYLLLADRPEIGPIILSLTSSGIKHSKKWMSMMTSILIPGKAVRAPMRASVWNLGLIRNTNDDGSWYQIGDKATTKAERIGWVTTEQLAAANSAYELITSGEAQADYDSTVDPGEKGAGRSTSYPEPGDFPGSDDGDGIPF